MRRLLGLALYVFPILACEPPTLPPTGRTMVLALEDNPTDGSGWSMEHKRILAALPSILRATGDTWRFGTLAEANIVLRTAISPNCAVEGGGGYIPGQRFAYVDPACAGGESPLLTIATHETLHAFEWLQHGTVRHVCLRAGDAPDCYAGGYGQGVLNPWLPPDRGADGNPLGPIDPHPTTLDLRVVSRSP